jgi:fructose-1,6-bisphosphatase
LKGLLDYKLADKPELEQAHEQPEVLEAVIVEEFRRDPDFYNNLQELVTQLQEAEKKRPNINTNQSTNLLGVTQNTNNSGQMGDVVAGDKFTGDKFR